MAPPTAPVHPPAAPAGDTPPPRAVIDGLFDDTYRELRRLAARVGRARADATLNPTALVNEAWIKLAGSLRLQPVSTLHFKRLAARAMRQVLVDAARRRRAGKRDAGQAFVTFDEALSPQAVSAAGIEALDAALEALARFSPRQAAVVECRFFGGLEVAEIATTLSVSEATVLRDWRAARAWLAAELRGRG